MVLSQAARAAFSAADTDDRIEAAGAEIAVRCWGRGQPVLCLHDAGRGSRDFEAMAEQLQVGFEIIALDWPGHGWSPAETAPAQPERWSEIASALLDELHLERAVILGHGLGAAAALRLAAFQPDRCSGLILADAPGLTPPGLWSGLQALGRPQAANDLAAAPLGRLDLRPIAQRVRAPVWLVSGRRGFPGLEAAAPTALFRKACASRFPGRAAPFLNAPEAFAQRFEQLAAENL